MRLVTNFSLFFLGLSLLSESWATELHTFDFGGEDTQIINHLDGHSSGSYTSVGSMDQITLQISTSQGVLDFTSTSGNLGIDASGSANPDPQSITLDFSSLSDSSIRIHSITMTSVMELGSPLRRTREFFLEPTITSQNLYRYDNSQSILLGSYNVPETGGAVLHVNNLQYGYHSIHSLTLTSESVGVPEPTAALLLWIGGSLFGNLRFRRRGLRNG